MITSVSNQQVKNVIQLSKKAKERRRQGAFIIEGSRLFREIPKEQFIKIYVSESFYTESRQKQLLYGDCQSMLEALDYELVADAVFKQMSDTKAPQGILGIVRQPAYQLEELLADKAPLLLILENLQDPGNLGTIFRTGEGAGATGIIMTKDCADLFAPKTVRATMGSIFRVPFLITEDLKKLADKIKQAGVRVYAAHLDGAQCYDRLPYHEGTAFLIGNEGNGLTKEAAALADACVKIPMKGKLESLNAAMAAGILLYEADRQRRQQ